MILQIIVKSILFTGISGQLGTALLKTLPDYSMNSIFFLRKSLSEYPFKLNPTQIFMADLTQPKTIFQHVQKLKGQIDTIVHMAALGHGASTSDLYQTIFQGTLSLYNFANQIECPKFLFFSSILASGWTPPTLNYIDETYTPIEKNLCTFGKMKLKTEQSLLALSQKSLTKTIILRPGNIYGNPKLSFIKFVTDIIKNEKKIFYHRAKKSVMWAPIYIDDVIRCIFMLLNLKRFNNKAYFLTGNDFPTLEELTKLITDESNFAFINLHLKKTEKLHLFLRKGLDQMRSLIHQPSFPDFIYSNTKISQDFGFSPQTTLKEGISKTIRWALKEELL